MAERRIHFTRAAPAAPAQAGPQEAGVSSLQKGIALNRETGKMYGYHGDPGQRVVAAHKYDPDEHGTGVATRVSSPGFGARLRSALSFRQRADAMAGVSRAFQAHGLKSSSSSAATASGGQIYRHSLVSPHTTADRAAARLASSLGGAYKVGRVQGQNGQYGFTAKHRRTGAVHSFHFQENHDVGAIHHALNHLGSVRGTTQVKADKEGAYYQHTIQTPHPIEHVDQHLRAYLGQNRDIRHRVMGNGDHSFTLRDRQSGVRTKITVKKPQASPTPAASASPRLAAPGASASAAPKPASVPKPAAPSPVPQAPAPVPSPQASPAPVPAPKPVRPSRTQRQADPAPEPFIRPRAKKVTPVPRVETPAPVAPPPYRPSAPKSETPAAVPAPQPAMPTGRPSDEVVKKNPRAFGVVQRGNKWISNGHLGEVRATHDDEASARHHSELTRQMYDRLHAAE